MAFKTLILIVGALFLLGASSVHNDGGNDSGRFKLMQLSDFRSDQYMLDTHTGKIWRAICVISTGTDGTGCGYLVWREMDVENISSTSKLIAEKAKMLQEK